MKDSFLAVLGAPPISQAPAVLVGVDPLNRPDLGALLTASAAAAMVSLPTNTRAVEALRSRSAHVAGVISFDPDWESACELSDACARLRSENKSLRPFFVWCSEKQGLVFVDYQLTEEGSDSVPKFFPRDIETKNIQVGTVSTVGPCCYLISSCLPHGLSSDDRVTFGSRQTIYEVQVVSKTEFQANVAPQSIYRDDEGVLPDDKIFLLDRYHCKRWTSDACVPLRKAALAPTFASARDEEAQWERHIILLQEIGLSSLIESLNCPPHLKKRKIEDSQDVASSCALAVIPSIVASYAGSLYRGRFNLQGQWVYLDTALNDPVESAPSKMKKCVLLVHGEEQFTLTFLTKLFKIHEQIQWDVYITTSKIDIKSGSNTVKCVPMPGQSEEFYSDKFLSSVDGFVLLGGEWNTRKGEEFGKWSVKFSKPLMDIGIYNFLGHIQCVVPHITEPRNNYRDPEVEGTPSEVPYCVFKSFPPNVDVAIAWAMYKVDRQTLVKPNSLLTCIGSMGSVSFEPQSAASDNNAKFLLAAMYLKSHPCESWSDCVSLARNKYEKYFVHKAMKLLECFPADDARFWQYPKRVPVKVSWEADEDQLNFVKVLSEIYATMWNIEIPTDAFESTLAEVIVKPYVSKRSTIVTDESVSREDAANIESKNAPPIDLNAEEGKKLLEKMASIPPKSICVDKITESQRSELLVATAKLRCRMYSLEAPPDYVILNTAYKRQSCPDLTMEVLAHVAMRELPWCMDGSRPVQNWYLRLCPQYLLLPCDPVPCSVTHIGANVKYTDWDSWTLKGSVSWTVQEFMDKVVEVLLKGEKVTVEMVLQGTKMIFIGSLTMHRRRKAKRLITLLRKDTLSSAELSVTVKAAGDPDSHDGYTLPPIIFTWM